MRPALTISCVPCLSRCSALAPESLTAHAVRHRMAQSQPCLHAGMSQCPLLSAISGLTHALHLVLPSAPAGRGQVAEYLTGGRGRAKSGALASAASPAPSLAALAELAPLLAAVAPDLARGLVSRLSARFLRELYVP
jgi:hypothetical protein